MINLDKIIPDFKDYYSCEDNFPTDKIFDWNTWRLHDNYIKVVREDENYDLLHNKKCYFMNPEF